MIILILLVLGTSSAMRQESTVRGCTLPPKDPHGSYVVHDPPDAVEGKYYEMLNFTVTCDEGYGVVGRARRFCYGFIWGPEFKGCERFCHLDTNSSVEYRCIVKVPKVCHRFKEGGTIERVTCPPVEGQDKGYKPCRVWEPPGTEVRVCRSGSCEESLQTCLSGGEWDGNLSPKDKITSILNMLVYLFSQIPSIEKNNSTSEAN